MKQYPCTNKTLFEGEGSKNKICSMLKFPNGHYAQAGVTLATTTT